MLVRQTRARHASTEPGGRRGSARPVAYDLLLSVSVRCRIVMDTLAAFLPDAQLVGVYFSPADVFHEKFRKPM